MFARPATSFFEENQVEGVDRSRRIIILQSSNSISLSGRIFSDKKVVNSADSEKKKMSGGIICR